MGKQHLNKFLDYFSKPLTLEQIDYLNSLNNVVCERVELFENFILSLNYMVNDTYLGEDVIITDEEKKSHFNWCWKKNIENFSKENIIFKIKGEHYYYLLQYFLQLFYDNENKADDIFGKIIEFWRRIMSHNSIKSKSDYDIFAETYKLLDKYFNKDLD